MSSIPRSQTVSRYGLNVPSQAVTPSSGGGSSSTKRPFALDDDSDDDKPAPSAWDSAQIRGKKYAQQNASALAQDASVFSYDEVYEDIKHGANEREKLSALARARGVTDSIKQSNTQTTGTAAAAAAVDLKPQSRYISSLLEKSQQRKLESDLIYERQQLKERQKEDHLYGDKDKFVTSAYREKLKQIEQLKKQQEEQEKKEAAEDQKSKPLHHALFLSNVLKGQTQSNHTQTPRTTTTTTTTMTTSTTNTTNNPPSIPSSSTSSSATHTVSTNSPATYTSQPPPAKKPRITSISHSASSALSSTALNRQEEEEIKRKILEQTRDKIADRSMVEEKRSAARERYLLRKQPQSA